MEDMSAPTHVGVYPRFMTTYISGSEAYPHSGSKAYPHNGGYPHDGGYRQQAMELTSGLNRRTPLFI